MRAPGGERVGALCLLDHRPRTLTAGEQAMLRDLAAWVERELAEEDERRRAAEVQAALLPSVPPPVDGWEVAGACRPNAGVGGDFFDWWVGNGNLLRVSLADVMGKGIGAAIVLATVRAVLRGMDGTVPIEQAWAQAAAILEPDLARTGRFVTAVHCRIDTDTGQFWYVDAGHGLAAILRAADGRIDRLSVRGMPVGLLEGSTWEAGSGTLEPGDTLVIGSDGMLEACEEDLHRLGEAVRRLGATPDLRTAVRDAVDAASGPALSDDVTVVAVRRRV